MKNTLIIASAIFSLAFVNISHASGNSSVGTLTSVNAGNVVQIKGTMTGNPDSCADTDSFILTTDNPDYTSIYAALLTAYASGASLRLFLDGCVDNAAATRNRAEVGSVNLQ